MKVPLSESWVSEFVSASAQNSSEWNTFLGHVSAFLPVGGELPAYVSGFPVQKIPLTLETTSHRGRKEEDSGIFTW